MSKPSPQARWIVFLMGEEDEYSKSHHRSYADAVFSAQCRAQTERRPKRCGRGRGFYLLKSESGAEYIITTPEGAVANGYDDMLKRVANYD
jgi:hypothetical protein